MSDSQLFSWLDAPVAEAPPDDESAVMIARCLGGEQAAYADLYAHYSGLVYRLAYSLLQDGGDAEEVLQDSFEYAFRRLDHFDPRKSAFKTWLYRITVSRCRNKRRRKWLPSLSLHLLEERELGDPAAAAPHDRAEMGERRRAVWAAINDLSPKLREVAILRTYAGLQYAEIGHVLDIPAKTAESRMRLAHHALRLSLREIIDG